MFRAALRIGRARGVATGVTLGDVLGADCVSARLARADSLETEGIAAGTAHFGVVWAERILVFSTDGHVCLAQPVTTVLTGGPVVSTHHRATGRTGTR